MVTCSCSVNNFGMTNKRAVCRPQRPAELLAPAENTSDCFFPTAYVSVQSDGWQCKASCSCSGAVLRVLCRLSSLLRRITLRPRFDPSENLTEEMKMFYITDWLPNQVVLKKSERGGRARACTTLLEYRTNKPITRILQNSSRMLPEPFKKNKTRHANTYKGYSLIWRALDDGLSAWRMQ